ncbi:hypothetical protein OF83DRAFT_1152155 [Amylostereum chailletii]|nr:hypothetical protein OF83DRAFT_1152155 [Amylostereum chailletii]
MATKFPLPIEEARPPDWLPEAHVSADLGFYGYHPPYPEQEEDILTAENVKNGLAQKMQVPAETWGAQGTFKDLPPQINPLEELENLMNQVFARRAAATSAIPAPTFRMPSRVTLNDSKRQTWFKELADSTVPLSKLGKSVPHGAKGQDLLDLLHANNVAIPRAVWFLRVFGANEMAGLRNRPNYDPTQYSVEWANVVTGHLKKQLGDIILPTAPRPGLNVKQVFKGVLSDPELRRKWISRFTYSSTLLRTFYSEGLVDNRTFLAWLVTQIGSSNLAQAGFLARLTDDYLDGILSCRALTRPFVEACLVKSTEIRGSFGRELLANLEQSLQMFIKRACLLMPDAFVSPHMWTTYSSLLTEILTGAPDQTSTEDERESTVDTIHRLLSENYADIKRRNDALLFRNLPPRVLARLTEAVADVIRLNAISATTDLDSFVYFDPQQSDEVFALKVDRLLSWSVTPLQYGDHRPYAAVTLLQRWADRTARRALAIPQDFLQDLLFDFLDGGEAQHLPALALLFGELVKRELFSYEKYVQRLIARCEPGLSFSDEHGSRHRDYLRWIPLDKSTVSLINQRKVTLHGFRVRDMPEETNEREIRREVRPLFPELFGEVGAEPAQGPSMESSFSECKTLLSAPRYEQVRAIKQWFLPIFIKHLPGRLEDPTSAAQVIRPFCLAIDLMAQVKCYRCMFDLCMAALEQPCSHDFLTILVETLRRYLDIWASMSVLKKLVDGLYAMHQTCKTTRQHSRALLTLLVEIDANRYLDPAARKGVDNDISLYAQALRPADANPETVPMHIQEILILPNDARPGAASMLANSLWYRYRTAPNWAWRVWDDTFAALRLKLPTTVDITTARARALCYAEFLLHVDQHLPAGLDEHIAQWLAGAGIVELVAIDAEAWDCVIIALMYLIVHGALSTTTVLQGLVYPLWEIAHGSPEGVGQASQSSEVYLRAAHDVFARLLLHDACGADGIPPNDRVELQRVRTRRQDAFQGRHISALVASIPTLVFLEHSRRLPKELGHMSGVLRCAVCGVPEFRQAVYRDLNAVRDAFERTLRLDSLEESLVEPLMDALRLILNVARSDTADIGSSEWLDTSALLSPWKLAATAIEVQFTLKQMGERLALGTPHTNGNTKVDRLIAKLLRHHMSTEEADFVAEMARGVGPNIVGKFVNTGLRFIANVLAGMELSSPDFQKALDVSSEQLRLLAHLTESVRDGQTQPPTDSATQDEFITALADKIDAFEAALSGRSQRAAGSLSQEQLTQGAILMARLLQFDLACRDIWTPRARALSGRLCVSVFGLAMVSGVGCSARGGVLTGLA